MATTARNIPLSHSTADVGGTTPGFTKNGAHHPTRIRVARPTCTNGQIVTHVGTIPTPARAAEAGSPAKWRPSEYLKERSLTTAERLAKEAYSNQAPRIISLLDDTEAAFKPSIVPIDKPLFQPFPSNIVLQSIQPFVTTVIEINFRNNDKVPRRLRIEAIDNPHFKITGYRDRSNLDSGKVAPGMDAIYILHITPEDYIDYHYNLVCITERETFLVPIQIIGARALLDFPDEVVFTDCPVKYDTTRTLLVRNIGNRAANFQIETEGPFSVSPTNGYLDVKKSMQIDVTFNSEQKGSFQSELRIRFDTGEDLYVSLLGSAENAHIRLEKPALRPDNTYITLASMKTIKIFNRSDIMAKYKWKRFSCAAEEAQYRLRRNAELEALKEEEKRGIEETFVEEGTDMLVDLSLLAQRYKNQRRNVELDPLLFDNSVFRIEPAEGTIWPNSFVEITVFFEPNVAGVHSETAYCDISGRDMRLPLQLKGEGVGPKARFSYDMLDVEDVFIDSSHKYEVILENRGDIDVIFSLMRPNTLFGPKFTFVPEKGILGVGEKMPIEINFQSNILGDFCEEFMWELQGATEPIVLSLKGRVVGPSFHFDVGEVNFHKVSYGFESDWTVTLINTSAIPMSYTMRLPESDELKEGEFHIEAISGNIAPMASQQIRITFTPKSVRKYDTCLIVDIDSVGQDLYRLPVLAESIVPEIKLQSSSLDYGDCFLYYPYDEYLELENNTDFPARYKLQTQEESAKTVFEYASRNAAGIIQPHSRERIHVETRIKRLGQINFPIFIVIDGNDDVPLVVDITSAGIGPNVILSSTELNWGKIPVLKEAPMTVTINNDSPIPAKFECKAVSDQSVFRIEPNVGIIQPRGSIEVVVTAYLDDSLKFTDIIKVAVESGGIHEIHLVARGQGSTITFDEDLAQVDFRDVFSNRECHRDFTVVNNGRRQQTLIWTVEEKKGKDNVVLEPAFEVVPPRFNLRPGGQQVITIKGFSEKAVEVEETLLLQGFIDKDPMRRPILETRVSANFVNPLLNMSPPTLRFYAAHQHDDDCEVLRQELQLTNTSTLPLHLFFRCPASYSIEPSEFEDALNPGDTATVIVAYDPSYHTDRVTKKEHSKLVIRYAEHPQKDIVDMYSEITFPNVFFDTSSIDYGCIANNTEQRKVFLMTNSSVLPVEYSWSFRDAARQQSSQDGYDHLDVPLEQVFDILPLRGTLQPGESETVEVTFYGHIGGQFNVVAVCDVAGGPKYEVALQGEVSMIEYQFDRQVIDFGTQPYQDIVEQDLVLTNLGRVSFDFSAALLPDSPLKQKIMVSPCMGTIGPRSKQRINVRCCMAVPQTVDDHFFVRIAQFEPVKIRVMGAGTFPRLSLDIPRVHDERYEHHLAEIKAAAAKKTKSNVLSGDSAVSNAPDAESEALAESHLLKEKTVEFLAHLSEDMRSRLPTIPKGKFVGSPLIFQKSQQFKGTEKKFTVSLSETSQVRLANYLCDFGNVIRNTTKRRTIHVKNTGLYPISFTVDKSLLAGTGFTVEPDKVRFLPGAPHHESAEITITYQARNGGNGNIEVDLPIKVSGGPTVGLTLRAFVTVPDLIISTDEIDFGEMLCGFRKTAAVRLHNPYTVPCEWIVAAQEIASASRAKKGKKKLAGRLMKEFEFVPSSGVLQPGEKVLTKIRFSPLEDRVYDERLLLKISMNTKSVQLRVLGKGIQPIIHFEPDVITMGPTLPFSEGVTRKFTVSNVTDYPLEMYSVEFDQQYLVEEELLKRLEGYENGLTFIPPREPGGPIPSSVTEPILAKIKQEKAAKEAAFADIAHAGVGDLLEPASLGNGLGHMKGGRSDTTLPPAPIITMGASDSPPVPVGEQPVHLILHGPPFSGRKSQARRISKAFDYAYIHVDEAIDAHLKVDPSKHADIGAKVKEAVSNISRRSGSAGMTGARASLTASGASDQEDHHLHPASMIRTSSRDDAHLILSEHYDAFDSQFSLPEELIIDIIRGRLHDDDCSKGTVFDGLESKYGNPFVILRAILRALPEKGRKPLFFNLATDAMHIREREAHAQRRVDEKEADIPTVQEVTEQEYDNMSEQEKEKYDKMISKYRKRLKEQHDRKKQEHRQWEEQIAMRLNERKAEEERNKAKKGRRPPINRQPTDKTAPSPGGRSDAARLSRNNLSVSEGKTGAMSPKLGKRHTDRMDQGSVRARSEFGDRLGDREIGDELSSRFTLSEQGDLFQNESTYRRVDSYSSTLEAILALLKDGEKPVASPIRPSLGVPVQDKKAAKSKLSNVVGTAQVDSGVTGTGAPAADNEAHATEEGGAKHFIEINASADEDHVFKAIIEHLPRLDKGEDDTDDADVIPEPYVEQILAFPTQRPETSSQLRYFTLLAPTFTDVDDDASTIAEGLTPAPPIVLAGPTGATGNPNPKVDNGRRARSTAKMEEAKPVIEADDEADKEDAKRFRWVLPPHESKELFVKFVSTEVGRFEQTLNFELVGARGRYSLHCVGECEYAQIVGDPKKVFSKWRKAKDEKAIVHGEYVATSNTFDFGPLLYSKPREKYLDKFPENRALLNITNPGNSGVKVTFALRNDVKGEVFFFEPQSMDLDAGQTEVFSIWAYPRNGNHFEDTLILSVKDNPGPYFFKISCEGVKPEVEVDKKAISFDKLLLGKTERRELKIRNSTLLPVAWKLAMAELLGDEFQVSPVEGILEPAQECAIVADFKGTKPIVVKKAVKLEVNDTEKIAGLVQEIPILVTAEAYDIAVDLHFPKGHEGGLDFGVVKVFEEGRQTCSLRNKGKYEVGYRFIFDSKEYTDLFTVAPQQGIIQPSDKPFQVQLMFRSTRELTIKDNVSCKCQIFEPATGEVTATIPVKLSARAVFSKFSVLPVRDLNFGALPYGTKVTRQFLIENSGEFDFRYSIYKMVAALLDNKLGGKTRTNSRASKTGRSSSPPSSKIVNRKEPQPKQGDTLSFGAFVISPTNGVVGPGQKQPIMVEFHSDTPGSFEEIAAIDISDRSPLDAPDVVEYRLIGESCVPGINTSDFTSIFEEHSVCKRVELFSVQSSYYAEDDRVFYFGPYLTGQQAQVRFKLSNPFKILCDVAISTRPRSKARGDTADFAFDCEPKRLTIPSHESRYVTVSFHPTLIQTYAGIFEAVVENVGESKNKTLSFELRGEGTLPRVIVEKPVMRSKTGLPMLQFRRLMIGAYQTLPITLKNDGIITARVKLDWTFKDTDDFECSAVNAMHTLRPQESRSFDVRCRASSVRKLEAELRVKVLDNTFEDTSIQVLGEGYLDDLSFEGLPYDAENEIQFGDCFINEPKGVSFVVINHSYEYLRVSFDNQEEFSFTPASFHIRPKGRKDVVASFLPRKPCDHAGVPIPVNVAKIRYTTQPPDTDWDDCMKSVRWVTTDPTKPGAPKKVVEQYAEPAHEPLGPISSERHIIMRGFADYSMYECDISEIKFKETLMFQTRAYGISIRNSGKVRLRYDFTFRDDENNSMEPDCVDCPFSMQPASGSIEAGDTVTVTVRFAPLDVGIYTANLVGAIPNLSETIKPLRIPLRGGSLRPFCHFEIEASDYIARRSAETSSMSSLTGALDPATKVIEFHSCGVKVRNTRRFYLVNPTSINYSFEWSHEAGEHRIFKCLTPKGEVMSGKKYEIAFEFTPESVDVKESLWRFTIIGQHISIPFLLVGQALEPNLFMDRPSLNFKSVLVGRQVKEIVKLVNNEGIPFGFSFSETSFEMNNEGAPVLRFSPTTGTVGSKSEVPIEISFIPSAEKMFNFNLLCNVRKKPSPLTINVKGEGYEIHDSLHSELPDGALTDLLPGGSADNVIDFGLVQLNEKRLRRVAIVNSGRFNFDFAWKAFGQRGNGLSISPDAGTVRRGERIFCDVSFQPTHAVALKDAKALCQINNGRSYHVTFLGGGTRPLLRLSKQSHDFGTQFIYKPGMVAATAAIQLTNDDVKDISFDVLPFNSTAFDIKRTTNTLAPGEVTVIDITFYPRESVVYQETIKIEINGLSTVDFTIKGQGTDHRVELLHPEQRNINLGAIRVGHAVTKTMKIINRSAIPATFNFGPPMVLDRLTSHAVDFNHRGSCTLRPKGTLNVELRFHPERRIPAFSEEIILESPGISKPLAVINGACQGIEVRLENDTLPFGAVVIKSSATRRLQLQNSGDIGTTFHWDASKFAPDFFISPSEGYISPGMEIPLEITFRPTEYNPDIRYENLTCKLEGMQPLYLTLTGMCIPPPVHNEVVKFSAPVRQSDTKNISLTNRTSTHWHVRPIIENDYWSGHEAIDIEPGQTKAYDVTFTPLEMIGTGDAGRHEGSVFFPLPDGTGILYKLYGAAEKPVPAGNITRDVPSKTQYTEILPVANWLKKPQRFRVIMELAKPDPSVVIKGHDFLDLPALLSKDYKLSFYAFKEGVTTARVIFKNETTQEFLFYNITFRSTAPGVIATYEMTTTVRQPVTREILVPNPLATPAVFNVSCNSPDINSPHSFCVQARTESAFPVEFLPLQARETSARLAIQSAELGLYQYDLKLVANAAGPERSLHFKVGLGGSQMQTFRFLSYAKSKTEYTCKIDSPDFSVEKTVTAPAATNSGTEVSLDLTYEPSHLGDTRTQLMVSSPIGGDYICPLFGHCITPRPQGPINIKPGSPASLSFRNVFNSSAIFNFLVDNPAFLVKAAETIGAKKTIQVSIAFKPSTAYAPGEKGEKEETSQPERSSRREKGERSSKEKDKEAAPPVTPTPKTSSGPPSKVGKLMISHAESGVTWTYYLRVAT